MYAKRVHSVFVAAVRMEKCERTKFRNGIAWNEGNRARQPGALLHQYHCVKFNITWKIIRFLLDFAFWYFSFIRRGITLVPLHSFSLFIFHSSAKWTKATAARQRTEGVRDDESSSTWTRVIDLQIHLQFSNGRKCSERRARTRWCVWVVDSIIPSATSIRGGCLSRLGGCKVWGCVAVIKAFHFLWIFTKFNRLKAIIRCCQNAVVMSLESAAHYKSFTSNQERLSRLGMSVSVTLAAGVQLAIGVSDSSNMVLFSKHSCLVSFYSRNSCISRCLRENWFNGCD